MSDAPPPEQLDAAADGAFSGKLADPADTLTKRGGKGHVVYEGQEYDRLAWTRRCAALGYTLAAGEGAILNAALIEVEKERDALREEVVRLTDLAAFSGEVFACALTDSKMPSLETRRQLHDSVKRAIDAALAVQPTTSTGEDK